MCKLVSEIVLILASKLLTTIQYFIFEAHKLVGTSSNFPASPDCSHPSSSMISLVFSSLFRYPMKMLRPLNNSCQAGIKLRIATGWRNFLHGVEDAPLK